MKFINEFTIGADPEFFIKDSKGNVVSAEGVIGGTKNKPLPFDDRGFFMQEDNVMVEFNIPPSDNKQSFIDDMEYAKSYLSILLDMKGYTPFYAASAEFSKETLSTPQACMFGCSPEYNVYIKGNNPGIDAKNFSHRFCGGHVHIGFDYEYQEDQEDLIKALDITLGLPALFIDKDVLRRSAYGKAGSCRLTRYGVEYRVLSNFWIATEQGIGWVYDGVEKAFDILNNNYNLINQYSEGVRLAIDSGNINYATEIINELTKTNILIKTN